MSGFRVDDMLPADRLAVRRLILDGLADHWGEVDATLNPDVDDVLGTYAGGRSLVVTEDADIVATGTIVPRGDGVAEIVRMSVRSDRRRCGLGRVVVGELLSTARGWGVERAVLETTSAWTDVVAFYLRCGFTISHTAESPFGEDTWFELRL